MPTFTAIALDRLFETGTAKFVDKSVPNAKPPIPNSKPISNSDMDRRNNTSATERKANRPPMSPALYATPAATPLPDSPSSFPPSPYIINHKRRGPRLSKSFSLSNVSQKDAVEKDDVNGNVKLAATGSVDLSEDVSSTFNFPERSEEEQENRVHDATIRKEQSNAVHDGFIKDVHTNGVHDGEFGISNGELGSKQSNELARDNAVMNLAPLNSDRYGESDFFDPTESMSVARNSEEDDPRLVAPSVEFYDAWDELSSESGSRSLVHDIDELREIRLSLLMEVEERKQAEEALNSMRCKWHRMSQELAVAGLSLPADPTDLTEDELVKSAEELRRQLGIARFVSLSVGRVIARAEMEKGMQDLTESKDFEIARLWDRVHYYEAVNREMSHRNQEAIEMARRDRQRKKRRQRWVWGSIATAITLGTAALAWSYLPTGKGSSSDISPEAPDQDDAATQR